MGTWLHNAAPWVRPEVHHKVHGVEVVEVDAHEAGEADVAGARDRREKALAGRERRRKSSPALRK